MNLVLHNFSFLAKRLYIRFNVSMWPVFQYYSYKKSCIVSWLPTTQLSILNQKGAKIGQKYQNKMQKEYEGYFTPIYDE